MEPEKLGPDSPKNADAPRFQHRSASYVRRPSQHSGVVFQDIMPAKPAHRTLPVQFQPSVPEPAPASSADPVITAVPITPQPDTPDLPSKNYSTPETQPTRRHLRKQTAILYAMAGLIFAFGLFVAISGLRTNKQVAAQVKQQQNQSASTAVSQGAPSVVKPSAATVQNYTVAPNLPKYLDIPKLQVHTRVLSEGVDKTGALQVPWNIYDTGWYNASAQPGQPGGMLVDGHSGIGKTHGVFYRLATLAAGDPINITRGDGKVFTYTVVKVQIVNVKNVDMASMVASADPAKPGLNLITCAGDQIPGTTELNERVQVYAVLQ